MDGTTTAATTMVGGAEKRGTFGKVAALRGVGPDEKEVGSGVA